MSGPSKCPCGHTMKHHKQTGHCRPGCECKKGMKVKS